MLFYGISKSRDLNQLQAWLGLAPLSRSLVRVQPKRDALDALYSAPDTLRAARWTWKCCTIVYIEVN